MAAGNKNIIFTGFVSGKMLDELYSNAYAACLPSDIEGMSLSLLEALAYKNALICSDIPENTAVAEDKAIYFKRGNVDDLLVKLKELCDNEQIRNDLRKDTDEFILKKYSCTASAKATYELYEKMMGGMT